MDTFKKIVGILIFIPFIFCYSFIVGPILMAVLVPAGVSMLLLILGYKNGLVVLKRAFELKKRPTRVYSLPFPTGLKINISKNIHFYQDAYGFETSKERVTAKEAYFAIFAELPKGVEELMRLRNWIVKWFGFKGSDSAMATGIETMQVGNDAGFLRYEYVSDQQVVTYAQEPNMAIWLSVKKCDNKQFIVATHVELRTWKGRVYMALIKPFHKLIAPFCIRSALQRGKLGKAS